MILVFLYKKIIAYNLSKCQNSEVYMSVTQELLDILI